MRRDTMPHFDLYQPDSIENALNLIQRLGAGSWVLAGGNDSYDWFKDRIKRPTAVVDLSGIASLKGIRETPEGLEVGALTTLTEIERVSNALNDLIKNISIAAQQQAGAAADITKTMGVVQQISGQTSRGAGQTADSIGHLAQLAADLRRSVADFKLPA